MGTDEYDYKYVEHSEPLTVEETRELMAFNARESMRMDPIRATMGLSATQLHNLAIETGLFQDALWEGYKGGIEGDGTD